MFKRRSRSLKWEEYRAALILILPAILGLVLFSFLPIAQAFRVSFYNAPLLSPIRTFVGLANYKALLADPTVLKALTNTILFAVEVVLFQVVLGLVLALLIRKAVPGVAIFRSAYFLPVMTSLVVVSTVWKIMYATNDGLINDMLRTVGLAGLPWLTSPALALHSLVILSGWKEVGFSMLILLGGLNNVPADLYEAASMDGSTAWHSFWRITLPLLRRTLLFVIVLATINAFKVFTPVYVMTQGGPVDSTQTLVYYVFLSAFNYYKMGYAAALSFLLLALVLVLTAAQFRLLRSDVEY